MVPDNGRGKRTEHIFNIPLGKGWIGRRTYSGFWSSRARLLLRRRTWAEMNSQRLTTSKDRDPCQAKRYARSV